MMSNQGAGQSSGSTPQASSTFPPSSSTSGSSASGHQRQLMADHFLTHFQPLVNNAIGERSSVWNPSSSSSSSWIHTNNSNNNNFTSSLPASSSYFCRKEESDSDQTSSDDDDGDDDGSLFSGDSDNDDDEEEGCEQFKVRLKRLSRWMDNDLSPVQQVVTILSLINRSKKLDPVSRSFIQSHIHIFNRSSEGGSDGENVERKKREEEEERDFERKVQDANSLNFWQLYFNSRGNVPRNDELLDLLLAYLPLVHVKSLSHQFNGDCSPDVTPLNILYLHLISSVLSKVVSLKLQPASSDLLSKCRSLMSIALISRCFTKEQKASLNSQFMTKLLLQSHTSKQLQSQPSVVHRSFVNQSSPTNNIPPSSSFTPSNSSSFSPSQMVTSFNQHQESSEGRRKEPFSGEGMSGVPQFLKTLRLHKYTDCFASLPSLESFMNLSEADLESLGVTAKGARKKFCSHLEKLRSRPQVLSQLLLSPSASIEGDILPGIQSALTAPFLSKESSESNLMIHLLLKVKSVELTCEQSSKLVETIDKCLQVQIWSREEVRMLNQLKEPIKVPPSPPSSSSSSISYHPSRFSQLFASSSSSNGGDGAKKEVKSGTSFLL